MNEHTTRRLAASAMVLAASLAIAGFTALGMIFDYPKILKEPTAEILSSYRLHDVAISGWFLGLTVGAALLAPIGVLIGRIVGGRPGRLIAGFAIASASVQVIGLSRWVLLVPGISDDALEPSRSGDAQHRFEVIHRWLGTVVGETIGYALTAVFTVLVVAALPREFAPRRLGLIGWLAAALIATGVVIPLGVEAASVTNFVGYVLWCVWLIITAVLLWRSPADKHPRSERRASLSVRR